MSAASDRLAAVVAADFANGGHRAAFPQVCNDTATVSQEIGADKAAAVSAADAAATSRDTAITQATNAAASAATALTARTAAENAVAGVTTGSTNSLAYPEQVRNLVTASDVVDVFVYDTRLDSDGGAWTERCSGTSWFQEALNTGSRGAKRAFPKVAILVLRSGTNLAAGLSIYDALDLDGTNTPRLWMTFATTQNGNAGVIFGALSVPMTSVFALNGRIWAASASVNGALTIINFPGDLAEVMVNTTTAFFERSIGNRNGNFPASRIKYASGLVDRNCNAVHARVLPGAPLDPASGLPIPTVAVATAGGASIIHPTGLVASLTGGAVLRAFISDAGRVYSQLFDYVSVNPLPYATASLGSSLQALWQTGQATAVSGVPNLFSASSMNLTNDAIGSGTMLSLVAEDLGNPAASMVANASTAHATGWQPGDTRLAALNRGGTGNAVAASLITNGDFTTNLAGWTASAIGTGTAPSQSAGTAVIPRTDAANQGFLDQSITTVIGETYRIAYDQPTSPILTLEIGTAQGGTAIGTFTTTGTAVGRVAQFTATATTTWLRFRASTDGTTASVDNVSANLAAFDGSARSNGLNVVGTLSRAAVATGADLAAWSGWSASNYLEQPYSAGLDFGSGDFSIAFWINNTNSASDREVLERRAGSGAWFRAAVNNTTGAARFQMNDGTNLVSFQGTTNLTGAGWTQVLLARRAGVAEIWVNGVREATASASGLGSLTNTSAILRCGLNFAGTGDGSGNSLALLRLSAYAPTPAQIARMFRDERPLFQANARAFLGGTSNSVRKLARSQFTRRLAVATGNGVSVFDNLQRVEYLTNATHAAALASNDVRAVGMESGILATATVSNAGVRRDAITGLDRMPGNAAPALPPRTLRGFGLTANATPLVLAPRIFVSERETLSVLATIVGRVVGAADGQRIVYRRRGAYYRDAAGNVTLQGSVETVGTDTEVTSTADGTLVIDTTAQTVGAQVTGVAATNIWWTARFDIERSTAGADLQFEETDA